MLNKLKNWMNSWLKWRKEYPADEWDNWYPDR